MGNIKIFHVISFHLCILYALARLTVMSPPDLANAFSDEYDGIPYAIANYGVVNYGKTLMGAAHYADPPDACEPLNNIAYNDTNMLSILVMERGNCTFVAKSLHAQNKGAQLVIVINNEPGDIESLNIVAADFLGSQVSIPTIMITQEDGEILKSYLVTNTSKQEVILGFLFPVPRSESVSFDFWMSTSNANSFRFLNEFYDRYQRFGSDLINFTPYYATWSLSRSPDYPFNDTENPNCISGGRYCAQDPDGMGDKTGRDVLKEDLRQICIWRQSEEIWWKYVMQFASQKACLVLNESCIESVSKYAGVDEDDVNDCYNSSFVIENNVSSDNTIFMNQRKKMDESGVKLYPTAVINGMLYKGNLHPVDYVFHALCEGYIDKPSICATAGLLIGDENRTPSTSASSKTNVGLIIMIIFVVIFVMVIGFFFYRRMVRRELQKEMSLKIDTMVSQYFAIGDLKKNGMNEQGYSEFKDGKKSTDLELSIK